MKLFLVTFLFSVSAMAGGKLTLQNNFHNQGKDYRPMFGLSIYQPLIANTAFNSWTGVGEQPFEINPDVTWFTTKNQLDFNFTRLTVSPGVQYTHINPYKENRTHVFIKVDYKLW